MDFIEYSTTGQLPGILLGITFFALMILTVATAFRSSLKADRLQAQYEDQGNDHKEDPLIKRSIVKSYLLLPLALVLALAGTASIIAPSAISTDERRNAVLEGIESTYDLELTTDELKSLDYPEDRPESNFVAFGSIEKLTDNPDGFLKEEIYLIWKTGEMRLAKSDDGERFSELEAN